MAARSLRFTASALWPMSAGAKWVAGKMHPLDDGVGRDHQAFVPYRREHGGVIPWSNQDLARRSGESSQQTR